MKPALVLLVLLCFLPGTAAAHASHAHHAIGDAVVVTFGADHGPPPAGWTCRVLAPGGDAAWTEGTTDGAGRFAFVPDREGEWRVRAFGADGHGAELVVAVDAAALALLAGRGGDVHAADPDHDHDHERSAAPAAGVGLKLAAGVGVLFGIFGVVALAQARRA